MAKPNSFVISKGFREQKVVSGVRFEIITVVAPPPLPPTVFPEVTGARLAPDLSTSFYDASSRSKDILNDLANFDSTRDTKAGRNYLRGQALVAKNVIDLTRRRVIADPTHPDPNLRAIFEDFDLRLDSVLRELTSTQASSSHGSSSHIMLTSFEQERVAPRSETVTVRAGKELQTSPLRKAFAQLVDTVTDMSTGFLGVSKDGKSTFSWSVTTTPAGADIYYSRLGEPEMKWNGVSDLHDMTLTKLRWFFRLSWGGCSKTINLNPWLQNPISIQEVKAGCQTDVSH